MRNLAVHAIGACTGLGPDTGSTMGALLTEIRPRLEVPFGHATTSVAAIALQPRPSGPSRLVAMAAAALGEVGEAESPWPVPVVLCCPGADEVACAPQALLDRLVAQEPALVTAPGSRVFHGGRQDLPQALGSVDKLVAASAGACVLLGVDSLLDRSRLAMVDHRQGLRSPEHRGGVVPGEAAVALLLAPSQRGRARPQIAALVTGQVVAGSLPGASLAALVERALAEAGVPAVQVGGVAHDLTGTAGLEEIHVVMGKLPLAGVTRLWTPHESAGEVGAASGILTIAMMAFFRERDVYPGAGLCIASDDNGFRAVALITMADGRR
jgi:3-oxoacyl-[acyl-carrier-protein] synthase I